MPIFEYSCPKCQSTFEELVFDDTAPACPACGSDKTTKLLSCACVHMPAPSRVGQTVKLPTNSKCGGCSGGSCSTCK